METFINGVLFAAGVLFAVLFAVPVAILIVVGILALLQTAYQFIRYRIFGGWFRGW